MVWSWLAKKTFEGNLDTFVNLYLKFKEIIHAVPLTFRHFIHPAFALTLFYRKRCHFFFTKKF